MIPSHTDDGKKTHRPPGTAPAKAPGTDGAFASVTPQRRCDPLDFLGPQARALLAPDYPHLRPAGSTLAPRAEQKRVRRDPLTMTPAELADYDRRERRRRLRRLVNRMVRELLRSELPETVEYLVAEALGGKGGARG